MRFKKRAAIAVLLAVALIFATSDTAAVVKDKHQHLPDTNFKSFNIPKYTVTAKNFFRLKTIKPIDEQPILKKTVVKSISKLSRPKKWLYDGNVSFYGPGFYGKRTACGLAYTKKIMGVAHKTLPCGTLVTFKYKNRIATVPVIDRGPYIDGRQWDLSGALCTYLRHCFTGPLEYYIGG